MLSKRILVAIVALQVCGLANGAFAQIDPLGENTPELTAGLRAPAKNDSFKPELVTPEGQLLLDRIVQVYTGVKFLEVSGHVSMNLDYSAQKKVQKVDFTAAYTDAGLFRHNTNDELLFGSTGKDVYVFQTAGNMFVEAAVQSPDRFDVDELPAPMPQLLRMQNPVLLMVLQKNPTRELTRGIKRIVREADVTLDDKAYDHLLLDSDQGNMHVVMDKETGYVRQVQVDVAEGLKIQSVPNVNTALITVDYMKTTLNEPVRAESFVWKAPAGSTNISRRRAAIAQGGKAAVELENSAAPTFSLQTLDEKVVNFADLKGSVVVLDFWATWCSPCIAQLPALEKIAKDRADKGLKIFAVNVREEKEQVAAFVKERTLGLPVLMDIEGQVSDLYQVGAMPQTVVIGKDGKVKSIFTGGGQDEKVIAAIDAALAAQ